MSKFKATLIIFITVFSLLAINIKVVNGAAVATGGGDASGSGTTAAKIVDPTKFDPENGDKADNTNFIKIVNNIIYIVRIVGTIISIVVLSIIGIKYMLGSIEERAEYKKSMKPYFIGAIILFGSTNLLQMFYNLVKGVL